MAEATGVADASAANRGKKRDLWFEKAAVPEGDRRAQATAEPKL
jgi:hypothetical protein